MKLSNPVKYIIAISCLIFSVAGFMVKLPAAFRHMDKEMHALFYFLAAALLNILFSGKSIVRHALLFGILYLFGMAIEYAQEYSNKFFHKKIHGRYDPEDMLWNLKGLLAFSAIWLLYRTVSFIAARLKWQQQDTAADKKS